MKYLFLFFIYITPNAVAFAQLPSSSAKFYRGDETQSKSVYDSLTQKWKVTEYHSGGVIASEEIFEKDGITPTDTLKAYFIDGTLSCKAVFKKGCLSGEFVEWYRDGKIKRRGEYLNCFKTGLWTEYYPNGQKKSEGRYAMSREDSLDEGRSHIDSERVEQEAIIFPGITYTSVTTTTLKGEVIKEEMIPDTSCRRFNLPYIVATPKNGIWKYWDEQGNLLQQENHIMGVIEDVREYAIFFIVIADTGQNYYTLYKKMFKLNEQLKLPIDTMGRYFNEKKNLIALPGNDEDELYAGSYFPRRYPSENLSLEYLDYYLEGARDGKTIALVSGIYQTEQNADSALTILKHVEEKAFKIKARIYIGCMH